ncbi:condensation domain-containing protein [Streptomyces sp. NBC_01244]|uniref:condensation domain-containing protein n=1 Tax=Streptomyces sp. NBC_01244 TaxID=2903797 RepID=UPI002E1329F4|nr:condensation domain-containing protein [Streptomyces sp. NBC_01244]
MSSVFQQDDRLTTGGPEPVPTYLPLSQAQLGMWLADQAGPGGSRHQIAEYFDVAGALDAPAFVRAASQALWEAEALRVRVADLPDGPRQFLVPVPDEPVVLLDLSGEPDPEAAAFGWMRAELTRPVDVTAEPLFTIALLTLSGQRTLWFQRAHHLAVDGHGAALFTERVAVLYAEAVRGAAPSRSPFAPLTAVLATEVEYYASPDVDRDRDHWLRAMADHPVPVSLSDRPWRHCTTTTRRSLRLSSAQDELLRSAFGRALAPAAVAATAALLHRATGAEDVLLSLPVLSRRGQAARVTPSMSSNVVPLRLTVRGQATFAELTDQATAAIKLALAHQRYRAEDLHRNLGHRRGERGLTATSVNVMAFPYEFAIGGLPVTAHNLSNGPVPDLAVAICRRPGSGLAVDLDAGAELHRPEDADRYLDSLVGLLTDAARNPRRRIADAGGPAATAVTRGGDAAPGTQPSIAPTARTAGAPVASGARDTEAAEQFLTGLFQDVLGLEACRADDSFFELGGDSVMAIQLVARAREAGWALTLKQVFANETAAALVDVVERVERQAGADPREEHDPFSGPVPATPMTTRLGELTEEADGYHQSLVLRTPSDLTEDGLRSVLQSLLDHHDLLRARSVAPGHSLVVDPPRSGSAAALIERIDATGLDADELATAAADHASATAARLRPRAGVMLRACWFDRGPAATGALLLVVHHLAVDAVSWRVLLRDLEVGWAAYQTGREPRLAPVSTSFGRWAAGLSAEAHTPGRITELAHWQEVLSEAEPLFGNRSPVPATDTAATSVRVATRLDPTVTGPLLADAPAAFHGSVPDVVLGALAVAIARHRAALALPSDTGVLVDVEGHGRNDEATGCDTSRTIGWFTSIHPVRLFAGTGHHTEPAARRRAAGAAVALVKEQLRAAPDDGFGFGLLRYLNNDTAARLRRLPTPQILFNYLGRVVEPGSADWAPLSGVDVLRDGRPADMPASHTLTLDVLVVEEGGKPELRALWSSPAGCVGQAELEELSRRWCEALADVSAHVGTMSMSIHTPSDFFLKGLSQAEIDELESELEGCQ